MTAVANDVNGVATGARVYLYSSNLNACTVDPNTYLVTRVGAGSAVIYGTLQAPSVITMQIALTPGSASMSPGSPTVQFTAVPKDLNGNPTPDTPFYYSSDLTVATVDHAAGLATRVAAGSANIYATIQAPDPIYLYLEKVKPDGFWHAAPTGGYNGPTSTTWDDVRGAAFGAPQLRLDLGAANATVSGGTVNTNGSTSYIANASAHSLFRQDATPHTIIWWGEYLGNPAHWGAIESADGLLINTFKNAGSGKMGMSQLTNPTSKTQPAAGVRSAVITTHNAVFTAFGETQPKVFIEVVGRCAAHGQVTQAKSTGFLKLGQTATGPTFGQVKVRGIIVINRRETIADRIAREQLMTDLRLGDNVDLYGQSDSAGLHPDIGDSITAGNVNTVVQNTFPVGVGGTTWSSRLQVAFNSAGKKIDVVNEGYSGEELTFFLQVPSGGTTSWIDDLCSQFSPARRAAGLKEIAFLWVTNDIFAGETGAVAYADLTTAIGKIHAAGAKAVVMTMPPRQQYWGTGQETHRLDYDTLILAPANTAGADARIDMRTILDPGAGNAAVFADPTTGVAGTSDPITSNTTIYFDGTHITDYGCALIAPVVESTELAAGLI